MTKKFKYLIAVVAAVTLLLAGCSTDADVSLENNRKAAEQFELQRRIVFVNGITDAYLLEVEGRCSFEDTGSKVDVICKVAEGQTLRHAMGLSDNVTYVVEQLEPNAVDFYHYRLVFKPEVIAPYIDLETSVDVERDG